MRAAGHLQILSELFEVTLAIVGDHGSADAVEALLGEDLKRTCPSIIVISRTSPILRLIQRVPSAQLRVLLEALWPIPLSVAPFSRALAELGKRLNRQHFDVVHCFRLNSGFLRKLEDNIVFRRSVLDLDAYESQMELSVLRAASSRLGKQYSALSLLRAAKWALLERLLIPRFDDVLVCSELDRRRLYRRFHANRWHVVPNAVVDPGPIERIPHDYFTFLFVGQLGYLPNWDAVMFFFTEVLPILRLRTTVRFKVLIAGRTGNNLKNFESDPDIELVLNPKNLAPCYARADAVIVPLRAGGGTRVKIIEAFSYGQPVISTTIGAEGLEAVPGKHIIIADQPEDFAEQCIRIMSDEVVRRNIAAAGRELWRIKYSQTALAASLLSVYQQVSKYGLR
jgi:glycosyltransferase involved in cell wall biosynthesis